ncbi:MAG TPA: extracellular solute-binding protein [Treponemataceae bacterium]|nr:extracellular solute-binding protein [Treponemataceae bacterium]
MKKKQIITALIAMIFCAAAAVAESANITVFRPAVNTRDKNDVMVRAAAEYTKQTGGKVKFIQSDWNNWQTKILTNLAAGEPIDVIFCRDADFPKFYAKGYMQSLDGYVDFSVPYLNKAGMDMAFKYEGKYYAASHVTSNHPWIIIYNKTLMEEEGIAEKDQPLALYKAGKWNFDSLRNLAVKLTKDTTGSGVIDRWGFANWWTRGFVYMNGSSFTTSDAAGNIKLNFEDQKLMEALTYLENAKKEGWYLQDNNIAASGIQTRVVAMFMERQYMASTILKDTRDELAYVPLPVGPGNKNPKHIFETDGYGIGNGSKNPTYAGKFIDICLKTWYDDDLANRKKSWPQEVLDLSAQMNKEPIVYPGITASTIDSMLDEFLGEIVWTGNSASAAIAGYTAKAESLIIEANKPMEKPVRLNFKTISEDFEKKGAEKAFTLFKPENKSVKVSIVSGKEAIKGKSLKISMSSAVDGEYVDAVITDPELFGIVGWRDYKVSFDVKILGKPETDAYVYLEAYKDDLNKWGWMTKSLSETGTVYTVTGYINEVNMNGKFGVKIGGHNITDIVIDNLVIAEK